MSESIARLILKDLQEIRKQADACRASDEDERVNRIMAACDRIEQAIGEPCPAR